MAGRKFEIGRSDNLNPKLQNLKFDPRPSLGVAEKPYCQNSAPQPSRNMSWPPDFSPFLPPLGVLQSAYLLRRPALACNLHARQHAD